MLYPKEDRSNDTLMFACRTCHFSEVADAACIYRNSLKETIAETPGNVQDVAQDPTVGDFSSSDPNTSASPPFEDGAYDSAMDTDDSEALGILPDFCTYCGQEILCPRCGCPTDGGLVLETQDPGAEVERKGEEVVEDERRERALSGAVAPSLEES